MARTKAPKVVKAVKPLNDSDKIKSLKSFILTSELIAQHSKGLSSAVKLDVMVGILG